MPIIKYSTEGIQLWAQEYPGQTWNSHAHGNGIAIDNFGNIYIAGSGNGYTTLKYSPEGNMLWLQSSAGVASSIMLDSSNNIYVTGHTYLPSDYSTIKYNSAGVQQWIKLYNGPGNGDDYSLSIGRDIAGNVYVTGYSTGSGTGYDFATIKYSQPLGIQPISNEIPKSFSLSQNYPNPFNPSTKIRFEVPLTKGDLGGFVKLSVYDVLGKEIATLVNEQLKPGSYEVDWNAANFPSGVYYYKLSVGDFTETKKMVLIK